MIYIRHLKTILWKNWKYFKVHTLLFIFIFEIVITFMLLGPLFGSSVEDLNYEAEPSTPLVGVSNNINKFSFEHKAYTLGFVLPKNQPKDVGNELISNIMNDPYINGVDLNPKTNLYHFQDIEPKIFEDENQFIKYIDNDRKNSVIGGIIFHDDFNDYTIKIRNTEVTDSIMPFVNELAQTIRFEYVETGDVIFSDGYTYIGNPPAEQYISLFVPLQIVIDSALIKMKTNGTVQGFDVELGKLSRPNIHYSSLREEYIDTLSYSGYASYIFIIFIITMIHFGNRLTQEFEDGTRKCLISMGVHRSILWLSWELIYSAFALITVLLNLVIDPTFILSFSGRIIFTLVIILYMFSAHAITIILSLIFKKKKTVFLFTLLIMALFIKFNELVYNLKLKGYYYLEKILCILFPPTNISMAGANITRTYYLTRELSIVNIFKNGFGIYILIAIVNIILYYLIILMIDYIDKVDFRSISFRRSKKLKNNDQCQKNMKDIEKDPTGMECYVQVKNIYKTFSFRKNLVTDSDNNDKKLGNKFIANNNISFNVYKDEIFAILGNNGAGKSTLINNMIGYTNPDSGETYYSGVPISKYKSEIHKELGICHQYNIIFDGFSVRDHFKIFCGIKGINVDIDQFLRDIDLWDKRDYEVQKLSGGQKRKFCIGLAFIGNPKYVFLDEPTTGLDPLSRRKIWNFLLKMKKGRVIFITTHYMDEADIIADRKLIMYKGTILCLGSSIYLKNHFHMKYSLEELENKKLNKELNNFALSSPMLEELFVKLERDAEKKDEMMWNNNNNEKEENSDNNNEIKLPTLYPVKKPNSFITALRMMRFRFKIYLRRKVFLIMTLLFPLVIVLGIFPFLSQMSQSLNLTEYPEINISANDYKDHLWNYDIKNSTNGMNQILTQSLLEQEFPSLSNTNNINNNNNQSSVTYFTTVEMEEKGHEEDDKIHYYVSNFHGNFTDIDKKYHFSIYYNESMPHSIPATINSLANSILTSNNINETFNIRNQPLNTFVFNNYIILKFYCVMIMGMIVSFILAYYGSNVVYDRSSKLLKQYQLNGVSNLSYWLSVLITDYIWFLLSCFIIIGAIILCKFVPFTYISIISVVLLHFCIASIPCLLFVYCISLIFKKDDSAFFILIIINIFPIILCSYKAAFELYESDSEFHAKETIIGSFITAAVMNTLFPTFGFLRVFKDVISIGFKHYTIKYDISFFNLFLVKNGLLPHFVSTLPAILVYTYILYFIDKKFFTPTRVGIIEIKDKIEERFNDEIKNSDEDLRHEYERVVNDLKTTNTNTNTKGTTKNKKDYSSQKSTIPMKFLNLTLEYSHLDISTKEEMVEYMNRKKANKYGEYHLSEFGSRRVVMTAYENVSFGINKCECFGLLGPNGSGKSSFLNTSSFTYKQTLGNMYYDGKNTLDKKGNEITLGYCPQEDVVWKELTLFEHIEMILYIHGYSLSKSKNLAKQFIQYCRLQPHKNKLPYELSGGTRRKLNIITSICSSSSRIMLDEPSAGMDPSTRRYVWDILKASIQSNESSIIMTTHSMEEAELLCNRLAIIVNGKLRCIGTPEHLKMKYGKSYILDVNTDDIERFHQDIVIGKKLFGNHIYHREDKSPQRITYEVENAKDIGRVFDIMESCRKTNHFTDYSYSQTTLEQVFLNFAALKENGI
ncbi:hypothetical protein BCR32DRAFT_268653 [Anaeromyces robustus]|uniref:ABC transporter domain-containing protein n=1 Tax=Anaeromyces robustus TaxID=1754192 RepID=A0A1Y1X6A0_9FUNG|nr:hypothetical protein BCR32DRAFT_268653 [Anaeromyces robustus]|eukprot:ORX80834.1 hypothetical protein BCR32DRAFT_268653 [Anaeromyces robustus]